MTQPISIKYLDEPGYPFLRAVCASHVLTVQGGDVRVFIDGQYRNIGAISCARQLAYALLAVCNEVECEHNE